MLLFRKYNAFTPKLIQYAVSISNLLKTNVDIITRFTSVYKNDSNLKQNPSSIYCIVYHCIALFHIYCNISLF